MNDDLITTGSGLSRISAVAKPHMQSPRRPGILNAASARSNRHSCGFTLIEMLVCIAILALIMSMVLPAIQNARESARAAYCRSNLAQLGEAFHAYHMTHLSLPSGSVDPQSPAEPGPDRFVWGWALQLLPQLDEQSIATRLDASRGVNDPANRVFLNQAPEFLQCPSGPSEIPIGYAGCHHDTLSPIQADNNGVLTLNSHVRFHELVDGLHQTILLGEAADVRWAEGTTGSLRNFGIGYGPAYVKTYVFVDPETEDRRKSMLQDTIREELNQLTPAKAPTTDEDDESDEFSDDAPLDSPQSLDQPDESSDSAPVTPSTENDVATSPESDQLARQSRETGFWPIHRNAGNFLMVDGSVRTVSRSVQLDVLRRLANRHDHQPVGEF
jgi:prepilin-type N-terminal cleavage/methylation domain-containing protein/prepilin-type processing-associated H-X9-DG protein